MVTTNKVTTTATISVVALDLVITARINFRKKYHCAVPGKHLFILWFIAESIWIKHITLAKTYMHYPWAWSHNNLGSCSWWRHQMETFSALLAICAGKSPVTDGFPAQRPVTRSFDIFFDLRLNKRFSKQSWGWWFETLSCPLWRHGNVYVLFRDMWVFTEEKNMYVTLLPVAAILFRWFETLIYNILSHWQMPCPYDI